MKKALKAAVSAMLVLSVLAGCGADDKTEGITSGMANAKMFDDMKKGETIDAKTVTDIFDKALDKSEGADSATIDTQVGIELTENGQTSSTKNTTSIKYKSKPGEKANTEETTQAAEDTTVEGETLQQTEVTESTADKIASVSVKNEYDGQINEINGYYEDGYLYYTLQDKNVKESMSYDDLMYMVGSYALHFESDAVDSALKVTSKEETKYTIKFDSAAMAEMMMSNMASAGSPLGMNENMTINEAYIYFTVDNDGNLSGFDMELDAKFTAPADENTQESTGAEGKDTTEQESAVEVQTGAENESKSGVTESPFKYSIVANFRNLNSTEVTAPENIDTYRDVNEVISEIQQENAETTTQNTTEAK